MSKTPSKSRRQAPDAAQSDQVAQVAEYRAIEDGWANGRRVKKDEVLKLTARQARHEPNLTLAKQAD